MFYSFLINAASSSKGVPTSARETAAQSLEHSDLPLSQIRKVIVTENYLIH